MSKTLELETLLTQLSTQDRDKNELDRIRAELDEQLKPYFSVLTILPPELISSLTPDILALAVLFRESQVRENIITKQILAMINRLTFGDLASQFSKAHPSTRNLTLQARIVVNAVKQLSTT